MKTLTLKRLLVLGSFFTIGAAAFVTPMPEADSNWGNTVVLATTVSPSSGDTYSFIFTLIKQYG